MDFTHISLNDLITISIIVAQAGIVYYRLTKVEQKTEVLNELLVELAVHKTSLSHYHDQYEKQSSRLEGVVQKLHDRIALIESKALDAFVK